MTGPNRLRDEAVPNTFRTGIAPAQAGPANARANRRAGAPTRVRSIGSREIFISGVGVAILGIPFSFAPGLAAQEAGVGLMCLGAGVAITIVGRGRARDAVAAARRSGLAAAGVLVFAPHIVVIVAAGLGLVAFGLMVLAIAVGVI